MSRPPGLYIVPSIHPARFFRDATMSFAAIEDWKKAARVQREGPTRIHQPIEEWQWKPALADVVRFLTQDHLLTYAPWSVDFEATVDGEPVCMALWSCEYPRDAQGLCIPILRQGGYRYWSPKEEPIVMRLVRAFLEDPLIAKGGQNVVGYDFGFPPWNSRGLVKRAWGIDVHGITFDTMVDHHACFPELRHSLAFQASCATDLPPYKVELHEKEGVGADDEDDDAEDDWRRVLEKPDEELRVYCLRDAYSTAECKNGLDVEKRRLRCEEFGSFGMAMVPLVADIGLRGLPFDSVAQTAMLADIEATLSTLNYRLWSAGVTDPNSSKKLGEQLITLGVPLQKRTLRGQWTTDLEVLGRLDHDYNGATSPPPFPFLRDVLDRSRLDTLRKLCAGITPCNDGKLRTALKYVATKSTRYSSSGFGRKGRPGFCPECRVWGTHGTNCQNFPKPRPEHPVLKHFNLRGLIRAQPGWLLASLDYRQLELRIQAYLMRCQKLIDRLEQGIDLHTVHAELMFGVGQVFGRRRKLAKNYIFAKRGAGGPRAIQIALAKDDEFVEQSDIRGWDLVLDSEYPEFNGLIIESQQDIDRMRARGERVLVRNGFGRPRVLSNPEPLKEYIATKISSTAAEIMNGVLWRLASRGAKSVQRIVLQIHDDFVLYAPEKEMRAHIAEVQEEMEKPQWLWDECVSFPVEAKWGTSWAKLEPIEV